MLYLSREERQAVVEWALTLTLMVVVVIVVLVLLDPAIGSAFSRLQSV